MATKNQISASWRNIFTTENIFEYARASHQLSTYLRTLFLEGYDSIVIPSRGAFPIFHPATTAWYIESGRLPSYDERLKNRMDIVNSPIHSKLVLPFSADPLEGKQTSSAIRRYWSKVLSAIVRRDGQDPHLLFYRCIVEQIAKRKWAGVMPVHLPSSRFIFIDTVVSGRAICEIFDAFESEGLKECYFLLILDENGTRIEGAYRARIDELVAAGRCSTVSVTTLFTEDRGPAVSGVWSTVYPEVMEQLQNRYSWSKESYGAGSFYIQVSSSQGVNDFERRNPEYNLPVTIMYSSLSTAYFTVLSDLVEIDLMNRFGLSGLPVPPHKQLEIANEKLKRARNLVDYQLYHFFKHLNDFIGLSPLDQSTTRKLAEPRVHQVWPNAQISISSSHLVRVKLSDSEISRFFNTFDNSYLNGKTDAFLNEKWWFNN